MAEKPDNNVIYLETDEDITSAIDKLVQSTGSIVQIVAPKRSTLLQSLINQKLIKKAASDANKELVIVTNDRVATNLAGRIGLPVAARVGDTPSVPESPEKPEASGDEIEGSAAEDEAAAAVDETPEADDPQDEPEPEPVPIQPAAPVITRKPLKAAEAKSVAPKEKRVPNFGSMQKRLLWGGIGLAVIIGLVALNFLITSAKVTLFAKATRIDASLTFTADPSLQESDIENGVLAADQVELTKNLSVTVPATGQKDVGTRAKGTMTVSNCYDSSPHTLVAGTRFQAPDGKIFRSDADVTVPGGTGSFFGCTTPGKANVAVTADQNGDGYNLASGTKYTIPALPQAQQAGINGTGNQMSGGTSKTVQVVTAADIEKAKTAALEKDKTTSTRELADKAKGKKLIDASLDQKVVAANSNPEAGGEAPQAKLSIEVSYTQLAVNKDELSQLAKNQEQKQLGGQNEIYDDGSAKAVFAKGKNPNEFTAALVAYAGSKIDKEALAKEMKGKKYGDAADIAARTNGVERADVALSPGWATSMPWLVNRIKIDVKVTNEN